MYGSIVAASLPNQYLCSNTCFPIPSTTLHASKIEYLCCSFYWRSQRSFESVSERQNHKVMRGLYTCAKKKKKVSLLKFPESQAWITNAPVCSLPFFKRIALFWVSPPLVSFRRIVCAEVDQWRQEKSVDIVGIASIGKLSFSQVGRKWRLVRMRGQWLNRPLRFLIAFIATKEPSSKKRNLQGMKHCLSKHNTIFISPFEIPWSWWSCPSCVSCGSS